MRSLCRSPGPMASKGSLVWLLGCGCCLDILFFFFLRFYLFMRERERGRDTGRGKSKLPAGSPMRDSIPEPPGHDPNQRQVLDHEPPGRPSLGTFLWLSPAPLRLACGRAGEGPPRGRVPVTDPLVPGAHGPCGGLGGREPLPEPEPRTSRGQPRAGLRAWQ